MRLWPKLNEATISMIQGRISLGAPKFFVPFQLFLHEYFNLELLGSGDKIVPPLPKTHHSDFFPIDYMLVRA